jgi:addiction module RelE/StbE family toxin
MAFEVEWTENALEDLKGIFRYLEKQWNTDVSNGFLDKSFSNIDLISNFPKSGIQSEKHKGIRKITVTKHISLFYKTEGNVVILLNFFDTRQDPEKSYF